MASSEQRRSEPSESELNSASLRYCRTVNRPEKAKPATGEEEMSKCTHRDDRGGWRGRALKEAQRHREIHPAGGRWWSGERQGAEGSHNLSNCGDGSRSGS